MRSLTQNPVGNSLKATSPILFISWYLLLSDVASLAYLYTRVLDPLDHKLHENIEWVSFIGLGKKLVWIVLTDVMEKNTNKLFGQSDI